MMWGSLYKWWMCYACAVGRLSTKNGEYHHGRRCSSWGNLLGLARMKMDVVGVLTMPWGSSKWSSLVRDATWREIELGFHGNSRLKNVLRVAFPPLRWTWRHGWGVVWCRRCPLAMGWSPSFFLPSLSLLPVSHESHEFHLLWRIGCVRDYLHRWYLSIFKNWRRSCETLESCVTKAERAQIVC